MNIIWTIGLRNLIRQKKRNILLGIAIAFGTMILVLANSFSHGISDVLLNKIMKYVTGHVSVSFTVGGNMQRQLFTDGENAKKLVTQHILPGDKVEEAIGMFCRAVGNTRSDNIMLIGIDLSSTLTPEERKEFESNFKVIEGKFTDVLDTNVENPAFVAQSKAEYMKLKKGDILRVRFQNIYGQNQAARITVAGIFKPSNVFMDVPVFVELKNLKKLLGYGKNDIGQLYLTLKNPRKRAVSLANDIYAYFAPTTAVIPGKFTKSGRLSLDGRVLGFRTDSISLTMLDSVFKPVSSGGASKFDKSAVFITDSMHILLGISSGDTCWVKYAAKYHASDTTVPFVVTGIMPSSTPLGSNALLVNDKRFFDVYYSGWPIQRDSVLSHFSLPQFKNPTLSAIVPEWHLMKRAKTTEEVQKNYKELAKNKGHAVAVDVATMYETGSMIIKLEYALNLITIGAVMVLFFIILIGVINTLRMTIRERTREIGTIRAIGMQKKDVRNTFIVETFLLTLFSSLAGVLGSFLAMLGLSSFTINTADNPMGMLLVNGHLHFVPTILSIVAYVTVILLIAVGTAYFPARRASNLFAAEALRHYE